MEDGLVSQEIRKEAGWHREERMIINVDQWLYGRDGEEGVEK